MPTYSIPAGVPTQILQNVIYALPSKACYLFSEPACEVGQTLTGPWAAPVANVPVVACFIRCTTGAALVTAKLL
jgi:hypothetical protein